MGLNGVAMQQDFAAAAQGHAKRRRDNGEGRLLQRQIGFLPILDLTLDFAPHGDV